MSWEKPSWEWLSASGIQLLQLPIEIYGGQGGRGSIYTEREAQIQSLLLLVSVLLWIQLWSVVVKLLITAVLYPPCFWGAGSPLCVQCMGHIIAATFCPLWSWVQGQLTEMEPAEGKLLKNARYKSYISLKPCYYSCTQEGSFWNVTWNDRYSLKLTSSYTKTFHKLTVQVKKQNFVISY